MGRKAVSIFLLLLMAFNLVGYRFCFDYLQKQADSKLALKIDHKNYEEESLITFSIPLSLPYLVNWSEFERVEGEVNLNGIIYTYVKRKVCDGKLILKCLPNHDKMNLETAKQNFFKLANDLQQHDGTQKNNSNHMPKNGMSEFYFCQIPVLIFNQTPIINEYPLLQPKYFPLPSIKFHGQPPDWAMRCV